MAANRQGLTENQHAARARNIGGSDVAALLGLSKWKTPVDLWMEKTGRKPAEDISGNPAVQAGIRMEGAVLEWFADETGIPVLRPADDEPPKQHPEHPRLVGHADGLCSEEPAGVEVKTASAWVQQDWGAYDYGSQEYGDGVPLAYVCQCLHYMSIFDLPRWYVAALIGGNDFRVYALDRDREFEQEVVRRSLEFLAHVDSDVPPEPTTIGDVVTLHPMATVEEVMAGEDIEPWLAKAAEADQNSKGWKKQLDEAKTRIADYMGEAGKLVDSSGHTLANFREQQSRRIDTTRLKKERPEIYAEYAKVSTTRPMRLNF